MHTYMSLQGVCVSSRGFLPGVCLGVFCLKGFVRSGFVRNTSEYICYNRKLNITLNFRFRMYEIFLKCDVTCPWTPSPVTNCHTFPDPLPLPLERDVLFTDGSQSADQFCNKYK